MEDRKAALIPGGLLASALVAFGSFSPWAVSGDETPVEVLSRSGLEGDGVLTLAAAIAAALLLVRQIGNPSRARATSIVLVALVSLAIAVYNVFSIEDEASCLATPCPDVIDLGWGLWLTIFASAALAAVAFMLRRQAPAPPPRPDRGGEEKPPS